MSDEQQLKKLASEAKKAYADFKKELEEIRQKRQEIIKTAVKKSDEKKVQKIKDKIDKIIIK